MSGKMARNKGAKGELEIANLLMEWFPDLTVRRNLTQTQIGGHDLDGVPGVAIEVKRVENLAVPTWWRQCRQEAMTVARLPLLVYRKNRQPWLWMMRTEDYERYLALAPDARVRLVDIDALVKLNNEQFKQWLKAHLAQEQLK